MSWQELFSWRRKTRRSGRRQVSLLVELLEDRTAPVVGNKFQLPALPAGTMYDGVVKLTNLLSLSTPNPIIATGALLPDGRHILTAAHVVNGYAGAQAGLFQSPQQVDFELVRNGASGMAPISRTISIEVPRGPGFQTAHANYNPNFPSANDIAILTLTDQEPGMRVPNRQMVAPYYGPQIGYELYDGAASEVGQQFVTVGYGNTGIGRTGDVPATIGVKRIGVNRFDQDAAIMNNEVQTVGLTGGPIGGNFTLTYTPLGGGAAVTTANIPYNAPANGPGSVQAALEALAPLTNNVSVFGGPGIAAVGDSTTWFISFRGALANTNVNQITIANAGLVAPPGGNVNVRAGDTRLQGGTNEQQTITIGGNPTGGSFTLTYRTLASPGMPPKSVTATIPWNAPANGAANSVQTLLENAATAEGIRPLQGNIQVTGGPGTPWTVAFINELGNVNVNEMTRNAAGLTGGVNPTVTITTTVQGSANAPAYGALVSDFDSYQPANDALGLFYGLNNQGIPQVNETQILTVTGNPTGGTFTLTFTPTPSAYFPNPQPATTPPIAWNANAAAVQTALQNAVDAQGGKPLWDNINMVANVAVAGGPAPGTPFSIQFINNHVVSGLAGVDVNQLTASFAGLTGGTNPKVAITTQMDGKSDSQNAPGDSGGPLFVNNQIAGVVSTGLHAFGTLPDFDRFENHSWGEIQAVTRTSRFDSFIDSALAGDYDLNPGLDGKYDLVLDLNYQMLGVDGVNENNLTITARKNGNNLDLIVGGSAAADLNGTYYSAPLANITSITLRGSNGDSEQPIIPRNLMDGARRIPVSVNMRGGNAAQQRPRFTAIAGQDNTGTLLTFEDPNQPAGLVLDQTALMDNQTYQVSATGIDINGVNSITYGSIDNLELQGSAGNDTLTLDDTDTVLALNSDGGSGTDELDINGGLLTDPTLTSMETVNIGSAGALAASGTLTTDLNNGGQLYPGQAGSTGTLFVSGDYTQMANGVLQLDLGDPSSGADHFSVSGTVTLDGTLTLNALPDFSEDSFILIDNTGTGPVQGAFAGLPEGTMLSLGGRQFKISYVGGDGNDVVLNRPPLVQQIIHGSGTLAYPDTTTTVSLGTSVPIDQSVIIGTSSSLPDWPGNTVVRYEFVDQDGDPTTAEAVQISRGDTGGYALSGTVQVSFSVLDFCSGLSVEHVTVSFGSSDTQVDVPLSTLAPADRAFVLLSQSTLANQPNQDARWSVRGELVNGGTTLRLRRSETGVATTVSAQIVTFAEGSGGHVQTGTVVVNGSASVNYTPQAGAGELLFFSNSASGSAGVEGKYRVSGTLANGQATFATAVPNNTWVTYYIVSIPGAVVQSGVTPLAAQTTETGAPQQGVHYQDIALNTVDLSSSFAYVTASGGDSTRNEALGDTLFTAVLTDANTLHLERADRVDAPQGSGVVGSSSLESAATAAWFVVQLPMCDSGQSGSQAILENSAPATFSAALATSSVNDTAPALMTDEPAPTFQFMPPAALPAENSLTSSDLYWLEPRRTLLLPLGSELLLESSESHTGVLGEEQPFRPDLLRHAVNQLFVLEPDEFEVVTE